MRYTTVLFDLDHTLLDTEAAEVAAYEHALHRAGVADAGLHFERYRSINREMWTAVERGELSANDVRRLRFERFVGEVGLDADPTALADDFVWGFSHLAELFDGAIELLDTLARQARLGLLTNGLSDVQRTRIERLDLDRFFGAIVISGEVGVAKPDPAFFDLAFAQFGSDDRATSLMVGDGLGSDMRGAVAAGIDACWLAPPDASPGDVPIAHHITALDQLPAIVTAVTPQL